MRKTMVDIPTGDGIADAYLVVPDGDGPFPGVLFFMDAFGLRPRLYEMAEQIAERGYAVLAPNLLYRGGRAPITDLSGLADAAQRDQIFGRIMPLIQALDAAAITRDTAAYLDFLAAQDGVSAGPNAVVGYCMGGTNALRAGTAYPERIVAVASFHGARLATEAPDSPHLQLGRFTGELYFAHADHDVAALSDLNSAPLGRLAPRSATRGEVPRRRSPPERRPPACAHRRRSGPRCAVM